MAGVAITVEFADQTFTGTTDANGVFTTDLVKKLSSGTEYYANVFTFMADDYDGDPLMDMADNILIP